MALILELALTSYRMCELANQIIATIITLEERVRNEVETPMSPQLREVIKYD